MFLEHAPDVFLFDLLSGSERRYSALHPYPLKRRKMLNTRLMSQSLHLKFSRYFPFPSAILPFLDPTHYVVGVLYKCTGTDHREDIQIGVTGKAEYNESNIDMTVRELREETAIDYDTCQSVWKKTVHHGHFHREWSYELLKVDAHTKLWSRKETLDKINQSRYLGGTAHSHPFQHQRRVSTYKPIKSVALLITGELKDLYMLYANREPADNFFHASEAEKDSIYSIAFLSVNFILQQRLLQPACISFEHHYVCVERHKVIDELDEPFDSAPLVPFVFLK